MTNSLLPRGVRLAPEDVWDGIAYVLSVKLEDPQFSGQTKERLSSRECTTLVSGVVKDSFALWLNQHPETGDQIALRAITAAQNRLKAGKMVVRKKVVSGPALPGKLADCTSGEPERGELFLVEGDSAGGSAKQGRDLASFRPGCRCGARSSTPGKWSRASSSRPRKCTTSAWRSAWIRAARILPTCVTTRSASSPTLTPTACT